jgi:hypothetical protein
MSEENYNKASCDMVRVADEDAVLADGPGSFCIRLEDGGTWLACRLPDGCFIDISIRPLPEGVLPQPSWGWDGNEDKPTLNPSVHTHGHWHGFFRSGRMESC